MSVRSFNNDGSTLRVPVIAADMTGDFTIATLIKPVNVGSVQTLLAGFLGDGTLTWKFALRATGVPFLFMHKQDGGIANIDSTGSAVTFGSWQIVAWSGFGGGRRFHVGVLGSAWNHADGDFSGTLDPPPTIAGGFMAYGYDTFDSLDAEAAVLGFWPSFLSDAQVEALRTNSKTLDWTTHARAPSGVWNLDQAAPTEDVPDLLGLSHHATITGSITSSTDPLGITGTTIVTTDNPPSWVFDVPPPPLQFTLRQSAGRGGAETSTVLTEMIPDFDRAAAIGGISYYACAYVHNEDALSDANVKLIFTAQPSTTGVTVTMGADPAAAGSAAQTVATTTTAPTGVTFSNPYHPTWVAGDATPGDAVNLGTVGHGKGKAVWFRVTITPNNSGAVHNPWKVVPIVTPL